MINPRRIAIVHTSFSLYWPARLLALTKLLSENGFELHVVETTADSGPYSFANDARARDLGGNTIRLFGESQIDSLSPGAIANRVWSALDRIDPEAVISGAVAFTPGATAVRWCRTRRKGIVVMDDARLTDVPRSAMINAIKRRVYANVDAMFVPAPSHLETCRFFGFKPSNVFFGVDVIDNDFFASEAARHRKESRLTVDGFTFPLRFFLGVGRQVEKKNWGFLLDSYALYRKRHSQSPWELVLIGDGPERASIEARIRGDAIPGVHLLPFLAPEQMPIAYANASALVLPSFYGETWGLVVNEAMASGLPVLVSQECGCVEALVENQGNGWSFSPRDRAELEMLLSRVAGLDAPSLKRMGERSQQLIEAWGLNRFAQGAWDAIRACHQVRRGFAFVGDRLLFSLWKGRFKTT